MVTLWADSSSKINRIHSIYLQKAHSALSQAIDISLPSKQPLSTCNFSWTCWEVAVRPWKHRPSAIKITKTKFTNRAKLPTIRLNAATRVTCMARIKRGRTQKNITSSNYAKQAVLVFRDFTSSVTAALALLWFSTTSVKTSISRCFTSPVSIWPAPYSCSMIAHIWVFRKF